MIPMNDESSTAAPSDVALLRREHQLQVLSKANLELNRVLEIPAIFRTLVEFAVELVGAEGGWAGVYNKAADSLHFTEYFRGNTWQHMPYSLSQDEHVVGWVIENKASYTCYDATEDPLVMPTLQSALGFTTLAALPIVGPDDELLAYLEIHDKQGTAHFDDQDLYMLMGLVAGAAVALNNAITLETQHKLTERLRLMARFFESSADGMVITDPSGHVQTANAALTKLTGHHTEDLSALPLHLPEHVSGETEAFFLGLWRQVKKTEHWQGEIRLRHQDGHNFPAHVVINALKNNKNKVTHYTGIFSDLSNNEKIRKLEHLAHHDTLTGLPNRLLFHARLSHALEHAKRKSHKLGVLFLDLDGFKAVNDTYGHDMGDLLLKAVARRLQASVRGSDTVARLGGDEFTIILEIIAEHEDAMQVADKIIATLAQPFELANTVSVQITTSVGISTYPESIGMSAHADSIKDTLEMLINYSDKAMYRAKKSGKNQAMFFSPDMI